jgi:hypothetical protein
MRELRLLLGREMDFHAPKIREKQHLSNAVERRARR